MKLAINIVPVVGDSLSPVEIINEVAMFLAIRFPGCQTEVRDDDRNRVRRVPCLADGSPVQVPPSAMASSYVVRDASSNVISRTRDEALCERLRKENTIRSHATGKWPDMPCGHCLSPTFESVQFYAIMKQWAPTWTSEVTLNKHGVILGVEACVGCGANFGTVFTLKQRAALLRGEATS